MKTIKKGNPKIKIPLEPLDKVIESLGIAGLILLFLLPLIYFAELPESIPSHINAQGEVDAYSSKWSLFMLPVIGLISYIGLFILNRYPHIYNYPRKIILENAKYHYKIATRFIRSINTLIIGLFAYLSYSIVQIALENRSGLESYYVFIIISFIACITIAYIFLSYRKKQ